jgi:hypothetical protein
MAALSLGKATHSLANAGLLRHQGGNVYRQVKLLWQHRTRDTIVAEDALARLRNGEIVPIQPETSCSGVTDGENEALSPDPFRRLPGTQHDVLWRLFVDRYSDPSVGVGHDG